MGCRGSKPPREGRTAALVGSQVQVADPRGEGQFRRGEVLQLSSPLSGRNAIPSKKIRSTGLQARVPLTAAPLDSESVVHQPARSLLVATAPADEDSQVSPYGEYDRRRDHSIRPARQDRVYGASLHQESQIHRLVQDRPSYVGPGPTGEFMIDRIYRCFDEKNGLLFRLVSDASRMWAFYNDTIEYMMRVSVTFSPDSTIQALGDTRRTILNEETGECQLEVTVAPGKTESFMCGEHNGFITCYDANIIIGASGAGARRSEGCISSSSDGGGRDAQ